jgi:hypothetical protein
MTCAQFRIVLGKATEAGPLAKYWARQKDGGHVC